MKILNLTQHKATPDQEKAGVYNLEGDKLEKLKELLTFPELPTGYVVWDRARKIADLAEQEGAKSAMIGGANYLMSWLENALLRRGINIKYSFSIRESQDIHLDDGTVIKQHVFRHIGFFEMLANY